MGDAPILSVCIASMDRPVELAETVTEILRQAALVRERIEVVVVDATPSVAGSGIPAWHDHPEVTVVQVDKPSGIDRDFDLAVQNATGAYCWLLPDDDRPRSGAIARIVAALADYPSLVLVNTAVRGPAFECEILGRTVEGPDATFPAPVDPAELIRFASLLTYIGCLVVARDLWMERRREEFFGSEFAHVGVVLSAALPRAVRFVADPQVDLRYGVAHWLPRMARVWIVQWPQIIDLVIVDPVLRRRLYSCTTAGRLLHLAQFRALRAVCCDTVGELLDARPMPSASGRWLARAIAIAPSGPLRLLVPFVRRRLGRIDPLFNFDLRALRSA
jgi:abequosyltransferase